VRRSREFAFRSIRLGGDAAISSPAFFAAFSATYRRELGWEKEATDESRKENVKGMMKPIIGRQKIGFFRRLVFEKTFFPALGFFEEPEEGRRGKKKRDSAQ